MKYLRIGTHLVKGSPVKPGVQVQIGLWLITWHLLETPQAPRHGLLHFRFVQAWFNGHSELVIHSGRQAGGAPRYPGKHEQTACP